MRDDQADEVLRMLGDILEEMCGLRSDFLQFTGYNSTKMSDAVDQITGPVGYNLGDLNERLTEVISAIDSVAMTADLK